MGEVSNINKGVEGEEVVSDINKGRRSWGGWANTKISWKEVHQWSITTGIVGK